MDRHHLDATAAAHILRNAVHVVLFPNGYDVCVVQAQGICVPAQEGGTGLHDGYHVSFCKFPNCNLDISGAFTDIFHCTRADDVAADLLDDGVVRPIPEPGQGILLHFILHQRTATWSSRGVSVYWHRRLLLPLLSHSPPHRVHASVSASFDIVSDIVV